MEITKKKLLKAEKKLTDVNIKKAFIDKEYDQLCQDELRSKYSALKDMKKRFLTLKIEKMESLKEEAEIIGLFENMERLTAEGFEYESFIRTLIDEFKKGAYSKQSIPPKFMPDSYLVTNEIVAKKIKNASYNFYESLEESFATEEIKRISREKKLGEWRQYFAKLKTAEIYYNYLDGSSTFALKPQKTCYDYYRYLWLNTICCASHIIGSQLSYSNQLFLATVPAFLNLLFIDTLTAEIDSFSKNSDNYIMMNHEIENFQKKYHASIKSTISLCSIYQENFNKEVYRDTANFNLTKYYRMRLTSEWITIFTKFLGYSMYKVWQEDSTLAFQMLDEYIKNFAKFSQTLDLSLIGLSDEDVIKYTRDFGKYGK